MKLTSEPRQREREKEGFHSRDPQPFTTAAVPPVSCLKIFARFIHSLVPRGTTKVRWLEKKGVLEKVDDLHELR